MLKERFDQALKYSSMDNLLSLMNLALTLAPVLDLDRAPVLDLALDLEALVEVLDLDLDPVVLVEVLARDPVVPVEAQDPAQGLDLLQQPLEAVLPLL